MAASRESLLVAVLGAGQLGRALLTGLRSSEAGRGIELAASTRGPRDLGPDIRAVSLEEDPRANRRIAGWADVIVLAVRPTQTMPLLREISPDIRPGSLIVPLAIGLRAADLESALPPAVDVVRAMPNLPIEVKRGVIGLAPGARASEAGVARARGLFERLGTIIEVPDERLDVLSMVSGAGPAYVCFLVEELTAVTRRLGFDDATAAELLRETFQGSLSLLDESGRAPSALLREIASPGSATERAIAVLQQAQVAEYAERAMRAALARAAELEGEITGTPEGAPPSLADDGGARGGGAGTGVVVESYHGSSRGVTLVPPIEGVCRWFWSASSLEVAPRSNRRAR